MYGTELELDFLEGNEADIALLTTIREPSPVT